MLILNTGGTFNKRYDPLLGELYVPEDNRALHLIVDRFTHPLPIEGMIYKDSLEMDDGDREALVQRILQVPYDRCIVVHGTDTMDQSAAWVSRMVHHKTVVFTGAMVPFEIDPIEASLNLALAIGYAQDAPHGVYIAMQGLVGMHHRLHKNRIQGRFEYVHRQM